MQYRVWEMCTVPQAEGAASQEQKAPQEGGGGKSSEPGQGHRWDGDVTPVQQYARKSVPAVRQFCFDPSSDWRQADQSESDREGSVDEVGSPGSAMSADSPRGMGDGEMGNAKLDGDGSRQDTGADGATASPVHMPNRWESSLALRLSPLDCFGQAILW